MSEARGGGGGLVAPAIAGYACGEVIGRGGFAWVLAASRALLPPPFPLCVKLGYRETGGGGDITRGEPGSPGVVAADAEIARGLHEHTGSAGFGSVTSAEVRTVIGAEVNWLRACGNPLFPRVLDDGVADGLAYYVMERIPGRTLREELRHGATIAALVAPVLVLLETLDAGAAASTGFYHGDLKPENIIQGGGGGLRLIDPALRPAPDRVLKATLTAAYNPLGWVGAKADTTALALILFEAATAVRPFAGLARPWLAGGTGASGASGAGGGGGDEREHFLDLGRLAHLERGRLESQLLAWVQEPPTYRDMGQALARLAGPR